MDSTMIRVTHVFREGNWIADGLASMASSRPLDEGCIGFAMEMMNLKASFARKLNKQGLSPIHLADEKGHKEMVLRLMEINKDLVRVKGKNGETPLHYISKVVLIVSDMLPFRIALMLKLLLNCKADNHATNQAGSTAPDVAQEHNIRESITILRAYQASLCPPGGVWQGDNTSKSKGSYDE
ncbi:hypothetical protein Golob_004863, partial [Gossypium lobatum]|nr:hypothetical protein [Gossypium lobatum]